MSAQQKINARLNECKFIFTPFTLVHIYIHVYAALRYVTYIFCKSRKEAQTKTHLRYEFLIAVLMKIQIFWDRTPYRILEC